MTSGTRQELRPLQLQYYEALKQLIEESGRYDQKDDFTVVLQPFMRDWRPPQDVSSLVLVTLCVCSVEGEMLIYKFFNLLAFPIQHFIIYVAVCIL